MKTQMSHLFVGRFRSATPTLPAGASGKFTGALLLAAGLVAGAPAQNLTPSLALRGDGKTVATFSEVGSGTWTIPDGVTEVEVLVVGGGGGGAWRDGAWQGGGGGAGGLHEESAYAVTPGGSVTITVGAGGAAPSDPAGANSSPGDPGGNSQFEQIVVQGGFPGVFAKRAQASGSLAEQYPYGFPNGGDQGGFSTDGGSTFTAGFSGGKDGPNCGGGGANQAGNSPGFNDAAWGGNGVQSSITGTAIYYGGGGGGSYTGGNPPSIGDKNSASGGLGGGGNGGGDPYWQNGVDGLGGGGGAGKAGGSGVVILAYTDPNATIYTVTFESNGGTAVSPQDVLEGGTATEPAAPTRAGYAFSGWFSDASLTSSYDFATPVNGDLTLYASWTPTYTVTFDSNGGSAVSPQTVPEGDTATQPSAPTRTGYTFDGWFSDAGLTSSYDFATPVNSNLTLYAGWTINTYTLTYTAGANGSISGDSPQSVEYGASGTAVTAVPDSGYIFSKWSDNSVANPRTDTNVAGDISVTAQFVVEPVIVTQPDGLNPGDQYRLIFTTSTTTTATSSDPAYYNGFVSNLANGVPELQALGVSWYAFANIGSTTLQANTGIVNDVNDQGVPIYRLDGTIVISSYYSFWNTSRTPGGFANLTVAEDGTVLNPADDTKNVWTGLAESGGIPSNGSALGNANVGHGEYDRNNQYLYAFFNVANTNAYHLYGVSDVITVPGGPADPYDTWASGYSLTGGRDDDDDGDGLTNFDEFAFGLDPTSGASANPIADVSSLKSDGLFSYTRTADSGLTYTVWVSTDLQDWGTEPVSVLEEAGPPDANGVQTVVVELVSPPTSDKFFVRVKAEEAVSP